MELSPLIYDDLCNVTRFSHLNQFFQAVCMEDSVLPFRHLLETKDQPYVLTLNRIHRTVKIMVLLCL